MTQLIIPIWTGTSTYVTGSTPFGFYDADATFRSDADKVADWCARRLGYPITDVELQSGSLYTCFEEAILEYSNQVNQFNIRDNMFNLTGATTGSNLTGQVVSNNLSRLITLATDYGTEAGSGGNVVYKSASLQIREGQQVYSLTSMSLEDPADAGKDLEIKKVLHYSTPASQKYFDPYGGAGYASFLNEFGWSGYTPATSFMVMPVYVDLLRMQSIEFNDQIRKSGYSFEMSKDRLRLFPIPNRDFTLWIQYIDKSERSNPIQGSTIVSGSSVSSGGVISDYSNVPYNLMEYSNINAVGKQWIYKYTLALAKETLGNIRSKYSTIPGSNNNDIQLNGSELVSQAQEEQNKLMEQLRENLESISKQSQMEKQSTISDNMQQQLNKIPLPIYIGTLMPLILINLNFIL